MRPRTHASFHELPQLDEFVAYTDGQSRWTFRLKIWLIGWAGWLLLRSWMGTCRQISRP